MQHCERDCEEDEFEGHFLFFSFLEDDGGSCWAEGAVVVGEEDWAWGRGGLRLGMMMGVRMEG